MLQQRCYSSKHCKFVTTMLQQRSYFIKALQNRCYNVTTTLLFIKALQIRCYNVAATVSHNVATMLQQRCNFMLQRFPFATLQQRYSNICS